MLANKTGAAFLHVAAETGVGAAFPAASGAPSLPSSSAATCKRQKVGAPSVQVELFSICCSESRTRGHTTKMNLWGSRYGIVITRRHKGPTASTTSQD